MMTTTTAGNLVEVGGDDEQLVDAVVGATGAPWATGGTPHPDVRLVVEGRRTPFPTVGGRVVARNVHLTRGGAVVVQSAGGSGFTQQFTLDGDRLEVRTRWCPSVKERTARTALPARFGALRAQVLLHHPALYWASVSGRAPVHASVLDIDGTVVLLAGPGGVGKSTLVAGELALGARATCDNLAVSDGVDAFGVAEPLRLEPGHGPVATSGGPRAAHGRREVRWPGGRVDTLRPDVVVVISRGTDLRPVVRRASATLALRHLVAGTYAAGELQRLWPLCAALALATGRGPATPDVVGACTRLAESLPCVELRLGTRLDGGPGPTLRELLGDVLAEIGHGGPPTDALVDPLNDPLPAPFVPARRTVAAP
jgi:hypothetical protein